jgi:hypothetical protein
MKVFCVKKRGVSRCVEDLEGFVGLVLRYKLSPCKVHAQADQLFILLRSDLGLQKFKF